MSEDFDPAIRVVHADDALEWKVIPVEPGDPNEPGEETVVFRSGDGRFSFGLWKRVPEEGPMEPPYHEIAVSSRARWRSSERDRPSGRARRRPHHAERLQATWRALSPVKKFWAVYQE